MLCLYPRENGQSCGQCANCLMNKHLSWRFRLNQEVLCSDLAFWLTLQYDDAHLPIDEDNVPFVRKLDCQNYFRQIRKYINLHKLPVTFKYFLVSEMCPSSGRPHYHTLFLFRFTEEISDIQYRLMIRQSLYECLKDRWYHGCAFEKLFHRGVVRYLTEYVFKPFQNSQYKVPMFRLISKGIGEDYLQSLNRDEVLVNNFSVPGCKYLPRYYRDKLLPPANRTQGSQYYWDRRLFLSSISGIYSDKVVHQNAKYKTLEEFIKYQNFMRNSLRHMSEMRQKRKIQVKNF